MTMPSRNSNNLIASPRVKVVLLQQILNIEISRLELPGTAHFNLLADSFQWRMFRMHRIDFTR